MEKLLDCGMETITSARSSATKTRNQDDDATAADSPDPLHPFLLSAIFVLIRVEPRSHSIVDGPIFLAHTRTPTTHKPLPSRAHAAWRP
jgi:hypothetical protein